MTAEIPIECDVDIDISAPAGAREVPEEEFAIDLLGLMMGAAGADALPIPTAPSAGT